jgi:hypothetical protein
MNAVIKALLLQDGGKLASQALRFFFSRAITTKTETTETTTDTGSAVVLPSVTAVSQSQVARPDLPTAAETTAVLKRRLAKELYKAELDLTSGMLIAGKPCDCLDHKHGLYLEAASEELVAQDPGDPVYQEIIDWLHTNQSKLTIDAISSGKYTSEYPLMANQFKLFRKRIMDSAAGTPTEEITLEQAKKLAADEAAQEIERQWPSRTKKSES